ncbi:MAG: bi-domain-containing oxidoreductase [Saprospiraceae bacterium]
MKQIIQSFKTGETILEEVPTPLVSKGQILIQTTRTLVSLGTERMLVEFGKANLIQKARQQPDKVKMVLDKIKAEGLMPTLNTVFNKLEQPIPLGYCNVGKVVSVGEGVSDFKIGDRVASNGHHAEFVSVPQNLVAHIPDQVSDEEAAFTVVSAIGLQGIRLLNPTFSETVVVIGLGLIGLITAELLMANGCQVIGIELDKTKIAIAKEKGIVTINPSEGNDPIKFVQNFTHGVGVDGVIITASAKTDSIISQAAQMCRKRGKIILVGVIGLNLSRAEFYEKELTFQVSCSYGPGRYDENYEQKGQDYPLPFVRWTEKRNFEAVLQAMQSKKLNVEPLISEVIPITDFQQIYSNIGKSKSIATLLSYPEHSKLKSTVDVFSNKKNKKSKAILGIIGAGNFTKMTMLPVLKDTNIKYIASAGGVTGTLLAKKYGIEKSTTDYQEILKDSEVNTILITTRHDLHAKMIIESLEAGKNVFVEKPLAINTTELSEIIEVYKKSNNTITVGFNRRFSPHIQKIKTLLNSNSPKNIIATMNAGFIDSNVWVQDMHVGGGRIIGEACHLIDLITYLTGSKVQAVCMSSLGNHPKENTDNATLLLKYKNGDQGVINYFSNGNKAYSKERIEVFSDEKTITMDNFRLTKGYGTPNFSKLKTKLDKGHKNQFNLFLQSINEGRDVLIPFDEIVNTTKTSFAAIQSLKEGKWIEI